MQAAIPAGFTAHNVRLDDGVETFPQAGATIDQMGDFLCVRNMLKLLYPEGAAGRSIVDLGCLEGGFTTEFARLGLDATGIEVRDSNLRNARFIQERLKLPNLRFHQDDAWNVGKYGPFDLVFCVGLYYHIADARRFLDVLSANCRKAIFIDTHFAPESDDHPAMDIHKLSPMTEHEGMRGRWFFEHDLDASRDQDNLEQLKWASWENNRSFWPTKGALVDAMRQAGFDMVLEDFDGVAGMADWHLSSEGWGYRNNRWMMVGVKL